MGLSRRTRYLKPDFYGDTTLAQVGISARYFYAGLWTLMDRRGLCAYDPLLLKRELFPYDATIGADEIESMAAELVRIGRLKLLAADGKRWLWCPKLPAHQKFHRDERPKYLIQIDDAALDTYSHPARTNDASANSTGNYELVTGNYELGTGNGELATGLRKKSAGSEQGAKAHAFLAAYARAFKARYQTNPEISGKDRGIAKRLAGGMSLERGEELVFAYLAMNDQWFIQRKHSLPVLEQDLNKVAVFAATGKFTTRAEARAAEQGSAFDRLIAEAEAQSGGGQ